MTAQILLEFAFVVAAVENQPASPRVADAVAEDDVESEANPVDEVVHVALETAVVVAREQNSLRAVEKRPSREVDGTHARKPAARVNVPGGVIDRQQHEPRRPQAHESWLEAPHRAELIADVVILDERQFGAEHRIVPLAE